MPPNHHRSLHDQRVIADSQQYRSRDSICPYKGFFGDLHTFVTRYKGMTLEQLRHDGITEEIHFDFMWYHAYRMCRPGPRQPNFDFVTDYDLTNDEHLTVHNLRNENEQEAAMTTMEDMVQHRGWKYISLGQWQKIGAGLLNYAGVLKPGLNRDMLTKTERFKSLTIIVRQHASKTKHATFIENVPDKQPNPSQQTINTILPLMATQFYQLHTALAQGQCGDQQWRESLLRQIQESHERQREIMVLQLGSLMQQFCNHVGCFNLQSIAPAIASTPSFTPASPPLIVDTAQPTTITSQQPQPPTGFATTETPSSPQAPPPNPIREAYDSPIPVFEDFFGNGGLMLREKETKGKWRSSFTDRQNKVFARLRNVAKAIAIHAAINRQLPFNEKNIFEVAEQHLTLHDLSQASKYIKDRFIGQSFGSLSTMEGKLRPYLQQHKQWTPAPREES